jgi:hypothetical protein
VPPTRCGFLPALKLSMIAVIAGRWYAPDSCGVPRGDATVRTEKKPGQHHRHVALEFAGKPAGARAAGSAKLAAHYIAKANREKLGTSGMDRIVACDQSHSLADFVAKPNANRAGNVRREPSSNPA